MRIGRTRGLSENARNKPPGNQFMIIATAVSGSCFYK